MRARSESSSQDPVTLLEHNMSELEVCDVQRRLEALEQSCREHQRHSRRWKRWAIGLAGCGLTLGAMGAAKDKLATIEAREFVLRDDNGQVRASWTVRRTARPASTYSIRAVRYASRWT